MDPVREIGKTLALVGVVFLVLGALLMAGGKLPFRLGRLPGDIVWQGENMTVYFPVVTCLVISVVLTLLMALVGWVRK